jgi:hypothetical protein
MKQAAMDSFQILILLSPRIYSYCNGEMSIEDKIP